MKRKSLLLASILQKPCILNLLSFYVVWYGKKFLFPSSRSLHLAISELCKCASGFKVLFLSLLIGEKKYWLKEAIVVHAHCCHANDWYNYEWQKNETDTKKRITLVISNCTLFYLYVSHLFNFNATICMVRTFWIVQTEPHQECIIFSIFF